MSQLSDAVERKAAPGAAPRARSNPASTGGGSVQKSPKLRCLADAEPLFPISDVLLMALVRPASSHPPAEFLSGAMPLRESHQENSGIQGWFQTGTSKNLRRHRAAELAPLLMFALAFFAQK
jgi:hypothetical protein